MLNSPHHPRFAEPPLWMEVHTADQARLWSMYTLHEKPPLGFESGWALMSELSQDERQRLELLCAVDSERVFPAVVNDELCAVIEPEFLASDSGGAWYEDSAQVIARIRRSLLTRLQAASVADPLHCGVVADQAVTFCGRPTVMIALPSRIAGDCEVRRLLGEVLAFAYPAAHEPHRSA